MLETWIEVDVRVPEGLEELATDALIAGPVTGAQIAPGRVTSYLLDANDGERVRASIAERVRRAVEGSGLARGDAVAVTFRALAPVDWNVRWRESLRPFRVGRLAIVPFDFVGPTCRPSDVVLRLEPGGSYGTGRHPSTRFALRLLQRVLAPGARVLDAGSGSGILAVAAVRLGAVAAVGFDVDPNAHHAGAELAARNGVADRCRFVHGDFTAQRAEAAFDGVLANLHADLLQTHAPDLAAYVRPGAFLVASGIRVEEEAATRAALERAGFVLDASMRGRKWMALGGRKDARAASGWCPPKDSNLRPAD